jgi:hypothetical protein
MDAGAVDALLSAGPLGAVIILLGYALVKVSSALKEVQDARVEDAKKVSQTLLDLNDKWVEAIGALTDAVKELKTAIAERRQ